MPYSPTAAPLLLWLTPSLLALLLYGLGQGFVKMWITEVPPARFCLYFACARAVVMVCYFLANPHTPVFAAEGRHMLAIGVLAYLLDGTGWIMYFQSIIAGPITIVGTLSAAYPALTIVFAHWFLGETLSGVGSGGADEPPSPQAAGIRQLSALQRMRRGPCTLPSIPQRRHGIRSSVAICKSLL